jgi:hypothetical protein
MHRTAGFASFLKFMDCCIFSMDCIFISLSS